jgi:hypothetical protein
MRKVQKVAWQAQAAWMRFASMFKHEWTIDDYPIRVRFQKPIDRTTPSREKLIPWIADVVYWPAMSGHGNTRQEALEDVRKSFDRFLATKQRLPRPGTKVLIEFAASHRVDQHSKLAKDFAKRVFELDWVFISNESSLWDFHGDLTNETLIRKIRSVYGVDVSDITSGSIADILDRIQNREAVRSTPD